jgi:hypothetical protein
VCYKPPYIFQLFWKAVSPFIDPDTTKKVAFLPETHLEDMDRRYILKNCICLLIASLPRDHSES